MKYQKVQDTVNMQYLRSGRFVMSGTYEGANFIRDLLSLIHIDDGDLADQLCGKVTAIIMGWLTVVLMSSLFWGTPITCWVPAEYTDAWRTFVDQYCFVHGTYYVPMDQALQWHTPTRRQIPINYYQWVLHAAIDMEDLANDVRHWWASTNEAQDGYANAHKLLAQTTAPHFWSSLSLYRENKPRVSLPLCYLFCKALQCVNALLQWFVLNELLSSPLHPFWGISIVNDLINGVDWQISGHFPRVTHCDFSRRRPASFQLDTVICVLTLNVYYEKVAIFLWFWMLLMVIVSLLSAFYWLWKLCIPSNHRSFIRGHLSAIPVIDDDPQDQKYKEKNISLRNMNTVKIELFIYQYLGIDGIFILRHLNSAVGQLPVAYLIGSLLMTCDTLHRRAPSFVNGLDSQKSEYSETKREEV